jgi:hypothetical protein
MAARDDYAPASADGFAFAEVWELACTEIDRLRDLLAPNCRCGNVYLNAGRGFGKSRESVGKNWNPDCPVHPWNPRLQAEADRSVDLQRQAAAARAAVRPPRNPFCIGENGPCTNPDHVGLVCQTRSR